MNEVKKTQWQVAVDLYFKELFGGKVHMEIGPSPKPYVILGHPDDSGEKVLIQESSPSRALFAWYATQIDFDRYLHGNGCICKCGTKWDSRVEGAIALEPCPNCGDHLSVVEIEEYDSLNM